jgi:branched-chain amino acid transport system permease protein
VQLFLQLAKTGVTVGLLYGLFAYGLSMILAINKVFHIAHALSFVIAAHVYYTVGTSWSMPLAVSFLAACVAAGVTGYVVHILIYVPLGRRGADPMVTLVASLTVLALGGFLIELLWGSNLKTIAIGEWYRWSTRIFGISVNARDIAVAVSSLVVFVGMRYFLTHTTIGLRFRAVGDHPERASSLGINLSRVFVISMILGSVVATPAAVIMASSGPIQAHMGFDLLLKAVLALTIGGMGSMTGALVGGIFIGLVESLAPYWLPTEWAEFSLFAVLFFFLVFRPQGLLPAGRVSSRRIRKSTPMEPGGTIAAPTVAAGASQS